jgi:two-component system chemotaxis response regulator CheB
VIVRRPRLVVMGTSLGGMRALEAILGRLAPSFPLPLALVQHRAAQPESELAALLQRYSALSVREAEDKEPLLGGHVYLAPPDYHLLVEPGRLALSTDAPVSYARPSIDVLFESAADSYRDGVVGVVLTGASSDGADGALRIKRRGGQTLAQDPATAEAPVMPRAAIDAGAVDHVLALEEIAAWLNVCCAD